MAHAMGPMRFLVSVVLLISMLTHSSLLHAPRYSSPSASSAAFQPAIEQVLIHALPPPPPSPSPSTSPLLTSTTRHRSILQTPPPSPNIESPWENGAAAEIHEHDSPEEGEIVEPRLYHFGDAVEPSHRRPHPYRAPYYYHPEDRSQESRPREDGFLDGGGEEDQQPSFVQRETDEPTYDLDAILSEETDGTVAAAEEEEEEVVEDGAAPINAGSAYRKLRKRFKKLAERDHPAALQVLNSTIFSLHRLPEIRLAARQRGEDKVEAHHFLCFSEVCSLQQLIPAHIATLYHVERENQFIFDLMEIAYVASRFPFAVEEEEEDSSSGGKTAPAQRLFRHAVEHQYRGWVFFLATLWQQIDVNENTFVYDVWDGPSTALRYLLRTTPESSARLAERTAFLDELLDAGASPTEPKLMRYALREGYHTILLRLLSREKAPIDSFFLVDLLSGVTDAAMRYTLVSALLLRDPRQATTHDVLNHAAILNDQKLLQLFLNYGADLTTSVAFEHAIRYRQHPLLETMLTNDQLVRDPYTLQYAIQHRNGKVVDSILKTHPGAVASPKHVESALTVHEPRLAQVLLRHFLSFTKGLDVDDIHLIAAAAAPEDNEEGDGEITMATVIHFMIEWDIDLDQPLLFRHALEHALITAPPTVIKVLEVLVAFSIDIYAHLDPTDAVLDDVLAVVIRAGRPLLFRYLLKRQPSAAYFVSNPSDYHRLMGLTVRHQQPRIGRMLRKAREEWKLHGSLLGQMRPFLPIDDTDPDAIGSDDAHARSHDSAQPSGVPTPLTSSMTMPTETASPMEGIEYYFTGSYRETEGGQDSDIIMSDDDDNDGRSDGDADDEQTDDDAGVAFPSGN